MDNEILQHTISPQEVQRWFSEWQESSPNRKRRRPIPEPCHCVEIASNLSRMLPNPVSEMGMTAAQIEMYAYRNYFSKLAEVVAALRPAKSSLESARAMWKKFPDPKTELPNGMTELLDWMAVFLESEPSNDGAGWAFYADTAILSNLVIKSLREVGWRKISRNTDGGPVMFVVSRCLQRLGHDINAAALGRSLRS